MIENQDFPKYFIHHSTPISILCSYCYPKYGENFYTLEGCKICDLTGISAVPALELGIK